jgi:hypothetical protein
MRLLALTIGTCLTLAVAAPACAQDEPRPYKKFDLSPDFDKLFKQRLHSEQQLGPLKDLLREIAANHDKTQLTPDRIKGLKIDDETKKAIKEWVAKDPGMQTLLEEWLRKQKADGQPGDMKKLQEDLKAILAKPPVKDRPKGIDAEKRKEAAKAKEPLRITEDVIKRAEKSKLGDWLRDSPAWRRALADLRTSLGKPEADGSKLGDWPGRLAGPEGLLGRLGDVPRPDLARWTPSLPAFNGWVPNVSAPSLPATSPPQTSSGNVWLFVLIVLAFLVAVWYWLRRQKTGATAAAMANLGSWPVQPAAVSTRAELVQAFDYLALLTLGLDARSWNHHAVVRQWTAHVPACAESASALASLYEHARYTDGDTLTDPQRDQARRSLLTLAEAL